jgi:hypothetical protein
MQPQHQKQQLEQQSEQVEQEQLLIDLSTTELASSPNHTIVTAPGPALCLHSLELEELAGDDDEEAAEQLQHQRLHQQLHRQQQLQQQ